MEEVHVRLTEEYPEGPHNPAPHKVTSTATNFGRAHESVSNSPISVIVGNRQSIKENRPISITNMLGSSNYRKTKSKIINSSNLTAIKPKKPVPRLSLCVLNAQSVRNLQKADTTNATFAQSQNVYLSF